MNRIGMILLGAGSLWLLGVETLHAELLRCTGRNGTVVFTNEAAGLSECRRYEPRSTLTVAPERGPADKRPTVASPSKTESPRVRAKRTVAVRKEPAGEVSFETLRMLSTGMTKAEVLSRAGTPRYDLKSSKTQRWVYSSADDWIVEIAFGGNRVTAINWTRSRP